MIPKQDCKTCSHYNPDAEIICGRKGSKKKKGDEAVFGCPGWLPNEGATKELIEDFKSGKLGVCINMHPNDEIAKKCTFRDLLDPRNIAEDLCQAMMDYLPYMVATARAAGQEYIHFEIACKPFPEDA